MSLSRARRVPIELAERGFVFADKDLDDCPIDKLKAALIREVLENGLTKKQKCYIILYYRDKLTMEQIAKKYSVNKSTVSRTINAARRKLEKSALRLYNI